MKRASGIVAAAVWIGCLSVPMVSASMHDLTPAETIDIERAEKKRAEAIVRRDINSLKLLLGTNYYHVESNGRMRSKTEFLQAIDRGEFAFVDYRIEQLETELFGNLAIVRGLQVIERSTMPAARRYKVRYVRVWQRQGSIWINTMHQSTELRSLPVP